MIEKNLMEINFRPYGISMGAAHSLVISEGEVYAWGWNGKGQLGNGTTSGSGATPKKIDNINNVVAVAWGFCHSMAMTQDGDVYLWGDNYYGQLGNGTTVDSKTPKKLNTLANINMIACSYNQYSMALTKDGEVYSWGNNSDGQLGNGSTYSLTSPKKVTNLTDIAAIACGYKHSIAINKKGDVYSWGGNGYGQLGNGSTTPSMVPQKITNVSNVIAIACSFYHALVLTCDGDVYSWGHNVHGQLGNGTTNNTLIPQIIANLTNIVAIACGYNHSMALTNDGSVYSWGYNGFGELGTGSTINYITPQKIDTLDNSVYAIACIGNHSMALTKYGHLYVWGRNSFGQLGNNTTINSTTPLQLSLPSGNLQWLRPHCSSTLPLYPPLDPKLLNCMESLANTLNSAHSVACDNHQFHSLYINQTQFYLHKAILSIRVPKLLNVKELDIKPTLFQEVAHFIYTNIPLNFKNINISQITHLIHLCKSINLTDLISSCLEALIVSLSSLTKEDIIFNASTDCHLLDLTDDELDWIAWFVGKNNLSLPSDDTMKLIINPTILAKLTSKALNPSQIPPVPKVKSLEEVMEVLCSQKIHTDFTINFKNTLIEVHKFLLAPRWPYFNNIMLKDQYLTVHNSPMPLDTFCKLIQYFYVGSKYLTLRDCGWILYLSEFYLLHDETLLLQYCDQLVNSQIERNWSSALELALEINNEDIEKKAMSMIPELANAQQIVSLCMTLVKQQQRTIQEHQKVTQENHRVLQEQQQGINIQQGILKNLLEELEINQKS